MEMTTDYLLGGKVSLAQPKDGYRVGIDPVLLAASVPISSGQTLLDAGAGVGAAMLCIAKRVPDSKVYGLEIQPDLVPINQGNISENHMESICNTLQGDIKSPPESLVPNSFDHVMTNPPHFIAADSLVSPNDNKAICRHESSLTLEEWINACVRMVTPRGTFTILHRADRVDEVIAAMTQKCGGITIWPLWPKTGKLAKLVIVQGRKGAKTPAKMLPGLTLHEEDGGYTKQAQQILSGGQGLVP
ncbi:MAG: tRNA1(Val) (adenine(37)-N6)-methyltransferase [Alphaproteobacteria bacterium]